MAFGRTLTVPDASTEARKQQKAREKAQRKAEKNALKALQAPRVFSSGRGGAGNIRRRSIDSPTYPSSPTTAFVHSNPNLSAYPGPDFLSSSSSASQGSFNPSKSTLSSSVSTGESSSSSQSNRSLYTYVDEDRIVSARGREPRLDPRKKVTAVGRGGAGNIRATKPYKHLQADVNADGLHPQTAAILDGYEAQVRAWETSLIAASAENRLAGGGGRGGMGNILSPRKEKDKERKCKRPMKGSGESEASSMSGKSRISILSSLSGKRNSNVTFDMVSIGPEGGPSLHEHPEVPPVPQLGPHLISNQRDVDGPSPTYAIPESSSMGANRARSSSYSNTPHPHLPPFQTDRSTNVLPASLPSPPPPRRPLPPLPKNKDLVTSPTSPTSLNSPADLEADLALDAEIIQLSSRSPSNDPLPPELVPARTVSLPARRRSPHATPHPRSPPVAGSSPTRSTFADVYPGPPDAAFAEDTPDRRYSKEDGRRRRWGRLLSPKLAAPSTAPDAEELLIDIHGPGYESRAAQTEAEADGIALLLQEQRYRHLESLDVPSQMPAVWVASAEDAGSHKERLRYDFPALPGAQLSRQQSLGAIDELHESMSFSEFA